jgi:hypothetical protein
MIAPAHNIFGLMLLAASGGVAIGFSICTVLMMAKIADLQREIAELRRELDASSFFTRFPAHATPAPRTKPDPPGDGE